MNRNQTASFVTASALFFAIVTRVGAAENTDAADRKPAPAAVSTAGSGSAASSKASGSAGLLNDWLRQQSSLYKAWDLGGELRARFDFKETAGEGSSANVDFMNSPPAGKFSDNNYLILREKFHVGYTPVKWFSAFVEARDSSSTGDQRDPNKGADQFDLHQAWFRLGDAKAFPLTAKVGRQELVYGDERMIGRSDWNNLGRAFDAALLRSEHADTWIDALAGRVVMADNHTVNLPNEYDWLSGLYASTKVLVPFQESQVYLLVHNVGAQSVPASDPGWLSRPSAPQDTYTVGLRFKSLPNKLGAWDYTFEAAAQFGNVLVGTARLEQQALAVMASGGYTWPKAWASPRLGLAYDFFSGDGNSADDRNGTFEPLFPTNHRPLGLMDLIGPKNIHDPRVTLTLKPAKPLSVNLEWHSYWLAETTDYFYNDGGSARSGNGYGRSSQLDGYAGSELDLDLIYTFKPWAVLRVGYGHFLVGDYVRQSLARQGGGRDADWFYTQLSITF